MPEPALAGTADQSGSYELTVERLLPASPERVFDAWINPETFVKWWGPEGFTTPEYVLDATPNGRWRTVMRAPDGTRHIVSGKYREIERPSRLVFTWGWEDEDGARGPESEVELTLSAAGNGTHLQLVHRKIASTDSRDSHRDGWIASLNHLETLFPTP